MLLYSVESKFSQKGWSEEEPKRFLMTTAKLDSIQVGYKEM